MARKSLPPQQVASWKELGAAVRKWRDVNGETQAEFGKAIGVSQPLVALVEKEEPISPLNVRRIAKRLAVDAAALLDSELPGSKTPMAYCASTRCPNLCLAANHGELFIAPLFHAIKKLSHESCPFCDLPLHRQCPECSKPIHDRRLVCPFCHKRFVQVPTGLSGLSDEELQVESDKWDERNRRIRKHIGFE
ncbi:MAG: hypothetical protein AABP62_07630 [Planctomycetota bacterium]